MKRFLLFFIFLILPMLLSATIADTDSGDSATDDNTDSVDDYTDNDAANTDSDDIDSDSTDSDNSKPTPIKNSSGCSLLTVD